MRLKTQWQEAYGLMARRVDGREWKKRNRGWQEKGQSKWCWYLWEGPSGWEMVVGMVSNSLLGGFVDVWVLVVFAVGLTFLLRVAMIWVLLRRFPTLQFFSCFILLVCGPWCLCVNCQDRKTELSLVPCCNCTVSSMLITFRCVLCRKLGYSCFCFCGRTAQIEDSAH